jgi:hypothetical protein
MMRKLIFTTWAMLLFWGIAHAQSVETYAGHKRAGVDLLWYKFMKNESGKQLPLLFFSRTRASTDWDNSPAAFGVTSALSYNFKNGVGIVAVASFLNGGFTPKTGVQLVKAKGDFLFFGWLVADLKKKGSVDLFGLLRYTPKLNADWRLFSQAELFPVFNPDAEVWSLTQRIRLGAKYHTWAAGFMADFNQTGKGDFAKTKNIGGFLRHDF